MPHVLSTVLGVIGLTAGGIIAAIVLLIIGAVVYHKIGPTGVPVLLWVLAVSGTAIFHSAWLLPVAFFGALLGALAWLIIVFAGIGSQLKDG